MQFLKTLFWVVLAVMLVLFATRNWNAVTINLWGGMQADVKLPVLVFAAFLLGFLPMLIIHRARLWSLKRRMEPAERHVSVAPPQPMATSNESAGIKAERVATDSKAWPTT
ncbi:LapA family protein [Sphingosinicella rhizophila]|uniref:LapA family protein n=1 Tax=Sphingosinicella rhizophila TaxID=3050082 RepID=A0ABU3Q3A0_9SPHN|nr:LapA family protein [Sphingosinicella sp. GR2756]MDT9597869.1 LapA family protein [Sphingosinicella sp. GR2756]